MADRSVGPDWASLAGLLLAGLVQRTGGWGEQVAVLGRGHILLMHGNYPL